MTGSYFVFPVNFARTLCSKRAFNFSQKIEYCTMTICDWIDSSFVIILLIGRGSRTRNYVFFLRTTNTRDFVKPWWGVSPCAGDLFDPSNGCVIVFRHQTQLDANNSIWGKCRIERKPFTLIVLVLGNHDVSRSKNHSICTWNNQRKIISNKNLTSLVLD